MGASRQGSALFMQTYLTFHKGAGGDREPGQSHSGTEGPASTLAHGTRDLDLDLMRCYLKVVECNSFSKAGELLGRTQSAVSLRLKRLERLVGAPLLIRHSKGVTLTRTGHLLLEHARAAIELNDRTVRTLRLTREHGQLRVGISLLHAAHRVPELLDALGRLAVRRELELELAPSQVLRDKLEDGELDLALAANPPQGITAPVLGISRMAWFASPAFSWDTPRSVRLLSLAGGEEANAMAERALAAAGWHWTTPLRSPHLETIVAAARVGLGVAALPMEAPGSGPQVIGEEHGLPALPAVQVHLLTPPLLFRVPSIELLAERLAEHLRW